MYSAPLSQQDFCIDNLGEKKFQTPLQLPDGFFSATPQRVIFNNTISQEEGLAASLFSFESPGPFKHLYFDSKTINVGIITCGGLCPGLNDVIRAITYSCLDSYKVKKVFGFRNGYAGLTEKFSNETIHLTHKFVHNIHEQGGTILGSSRGAQPIEDMVDTLEKFAISILFVTGGDGTHHGSLRIAEEVKKRNLSIAIIGIPKTIDNDISYIHKTFGFDTAVEEARKAINAAHVEATCAFNGIGLVKLMGRDAGFIAAHAALASGNVNICLIPEEPFDLKTLFQRVKSQLIKRKHLVIVVAEGVGQDLIVEDTIRRFDDSGNPKLKDIGPFLRHKIIEFLDQQQIPHTLKYIDPSYMIRSTPANAVDSSFCLQLGNYAVHAGMAGKTNTLIGYWNQHFCLVPIKLALRTKKTVNINDAMWRAVLEITN
jgi:6-phosphofructokinase 1